MVVHGDTIDNHPNCIMDSIMGASEPFTLFSKIPNAHVIKFLRVINTSSMSPKHCIMYLTKSNSNN